MAGVEIKNMDKVQAMLREVESAAGGRTELLKPVYAGVSSKGLRVVFDRFNEGGGAQKWKGLSWVTKALRKKGKGRKAVTIDDLVSKKARPLLDTGTLRTSFDPNRRSGTGVVRRISGNEATVGSSLERAHTHQHGGSSTFKFGKEEHKLLEKNMVMSFGGAATARRYRRWNKDFFIARAVMRKMDGKSIHQQARPMIPKRWSSSDLKDFEKITAFETQKVLDALAQKAGGKA